MLDVGCWMLEVVTAIPPQAGEAGGWRSSTIEVGNCDPAKGGRSKRINVGEAALPKMPDKLKNA